MLRCAKNRVLAFEEVFRGTAHNDPSVAMDPSLADEYITRRRRDAPRCSWNGHPRAGPRPCRERPPLLLSEPWTASEIAPLALRSPGSAGIKSGPGEGT
jgi:hypothetical protein